MIFFLSAQPILKNSKIFFLDDTMTRKQKGSKGEDDKMCKWNHARGKKTLLILLNEAFWSVWKW